MKNNIKSYWLSTPKFFADSYRIKKGLGYFVYSFLNSRLQKISELLKGIELKNKKMLDVGCGEGQYLAYFLSKGSYVSGVDYSSKMLKLAKKYLQEKGFDRFSLIKADANKLPFGKNHFDIVLAIGLLEYLVIPEKAVSEIARVLKPNGYAIFSFSKKWSPFFFLRMFPGTIVRNKIFKIPNLEATFDENSTKKLLIKNKLEMVKRQTIMHTEWLILCRKHP